MHLAVAVEVHRPVEGGAGLELAEPLFQQQRVGADGDEFLAVERAPDDPGQVLVQQRLAAGDHHHRRAAFVDRLHAFFIGKALVENLVGIIDLAATGALQIAAKQRLQHQHQRVALATHEMLLDDIGANARALEHRYTHTVRLSGFSDADVKSARDACYRGAFDTTPPKKVRRKP